MKNRIPLKQKSKTEIWVIKAGSQMVIEGGPMLIRSWMSQVNDLVRDQGIRVIWVTSGAIASARKRTGKVPKLLKEKQALSAIGQPHLMNHYLLALQELSSQGAQILLTADDLASKTRRKYILQSLRTLLKWGYLPILNENDAVATEEIRFGDNDQLASLVATHIKAKRLVLLTDVEGLYDRDPKSSPDAKLIQSLDGIPRGLIKKLRTADRSAKSSVGRGGMLSKILAAENVIRRGIDCHLVKGDLPNAIGLIIGKTPPGTHIRPKRKTR